MRPASTHWFPAIALPRFCNSISARAAIAAGALPAAVALAMILSLSAAPARAAINLELRPQTRSVAPGGFINFGLYAVSDSAWDQSLAAAQVIIAWQPGTMQLIGLLNNPPGGGGGGAALLVSSFGPEPYGLNGPPGGLTDGDAMWLGYAPLGQPVPATAAGTLLTTFRFQADLAAPPGTIAQLDLPISAGNPLGYTTVFDGLVPNLNVTGTLTGASVQIVPAPPAALFIIGLALISPSRPRKRATR